MRSNAGRGANASPARGEGLAEPLFDQSQEFVVAHRVEHVFQPCLEAVVRSPRSMKARTIASDTLVASAADDDVAVFGEIPMTCNPAEP